MSTRILVLISVMYFASVVSGVSPRAEAREPGSPVQGEVQTIVVEGPALMVVPSRYTVIQFAFDIVRLRPVTLVVYESGAASAYPVMHIWEHQTREWVRTSIEEYSSGGIFDAMPQRVIVIGSDADLPSARRW